ncbi:Hypothetical predicted protein [Mytilus galloprovincialis]|uniref:SRCR domain-containing protein n=1 Tax=Mytilus galloprovincialis TaxID=29158 RepID=A0A8B6DZI1_MYTGA|nr:Hypothetical predicted protein [Mytilus galloprovincialis]
MASDKVTSPPGKKDYKRTSSFCGKNSNLSDLESCMMTRIEEQDKQFDSMIAYMGILRITAGHAKNQGRLEINYRGEWGTVCGNHFGNVDAEVACKQPGYCSGIMQPGNLIRHGKGAIWLNDVNCSGSESKLLDCNFNNVTIQCDHFWNDVSIHCFLNCSTEDEGSLRITAGYAKHQVDWKLSIEVKWGTVCGNHFGTLMQK